MTAVWYLYVRLYVRLYASLYLCMCMLKIILWLDDGQGGEEGRGGRRKKEREAEREEGGWMGGEVWTLLLRAFPSVWGHAVKPTLCSE